MKMQVSLLVAIEEREMRESIANSFSATDYFVVVASSPESLLRLKDSHTTGCLIITSAMAAARVNGERDSLMIVDMFSNNPIVILFDKKDLGMLPRIYQPPYSIHDFCTVPFSIEELIFQVEKVINNDRLRYC